MHPLRLAVAFALWFALTSLVTSAAAEQAQSKVTRYARFQAGDTIAYGIVEGDRVRPIDGDLFGDWKPDRSDTTRSRRSSCSCRRLGHRKCWRWPATTRAILAAAIM